MKENDFIKPVCLPGGEIIYEDTACYAIGWGIGKEGIYASQSNGTISVWTE